MEQPKLTLGILGGGQLAQMLVENSPFHDLEICVFTDVLECPAKYTSGQLFKGSTKDPEALRRFFQKVNFVTFENEFIDCEALARMKEEFPKVFILPSIPNIQITQNKLSQKFLFQKLNLPTAGFFALDPKIDEPSSWLRSLIVKPFSAGLKNNRSENSFSKGCFMLKRAMGGYDGKGNFAVKTLGDLEKAVDFCQATLVDNSTVYAEELIPFERELAQVYSRSMNGDFIAYPLVISEQEKNVCRLVYGPATEFGIDKSVEAKTSQIGRKLAEELQFVGTFAIEYFYVQGEVIINEMAPRVHNSGHYSLDASPVNQFETHLRAILGSKLKQPSTYPFFAMRNILGLEGLEQDFDSSVKERFQKSEDAKVYWYNKTKTKSLRKLGHINTISMTKDDLMRKIKLMEDIEVNFWKTF